MNPCVQFLPSTQTAIASHSSLSVASEVQLVCDLLLMCTLSFHSSSTTTAEGRRSQGRPLKTLACTTVILKGLLRLELRHTSREGGRDPLGTPSHCSHAPSPGPFIASSPPRETLNKGRNGRCTCVLSFLRRHGCHGGYGVQRLGSCIWHSKVRRGHCGHVRHATRADHEVHHPSCHGWYHCYLRTCGGCAHCWKA